MLRWKIVVCAIGFAFLLLGKVHAEGLPMPTGKVILTVSGDISITNVGDTAQFDDAMLNDIGQKDIKTRTPWHEGEVVFTGTPLSALLDTVGAEGSDIKVLSLNDYEANIPVSDALDAGVILATRLDGKVMAIRDKGPIFVIYPYSGDARFQTQTYYARSAWQVAELVVR